MSNSSVTSRLGTEPITKLLISFSIPAIVAMFVNSIYNVVDSIFVGKGMGQAAPAALSGISVCLPVMLVVLGFIMLFGIGGNALASITLGENKKHEAEHILGNVLSSLVVVSIILAAIIYIFKEPILKISGGSVDNPDVMKYGYEYLGIVVLCIPFQAIAFGLNHFIRSEGRPRFAMASMLLGAIVNIILDPVFIITLKMGVKGAAIATVIANFSSMIFVLTYFSSISVLKIRLKNLKPDLNVLKRIVSLGFSMFFMQIIASVITLLMNNVIKTFVFLNFMGISKAYDPTSAISAYNISTRLQLLILMPMFGLNQGAQPILGYNYGAKQYDRVLKTLKYTIIAACTVSFAGFLICQIFAQQLVQIFIDTSIENEGIDDFMELGVVMVRTLLISAPILGIQIIGVAFFQSIGKAYISATLSLLRQAIILIPLILILPRFFNMTGAIIATPLSDLLAVIITVLFLIKQIKIMKNL